MKRITVVFMFVLAAGSVLGQITKEKVEVMGRNGQRYHAAAGFQVTDWKVFGSQPKYESEAQFNGFALTTAGALGLNQGWNELPANVAVLVELNPNEPVRYFGTQYWLDNCKVNGKRYKNRFKPVTPSPPPAPPVKVERPPFRMPSIIVGRTEVDYSLEIWTPVVPSTRVEEKHSCPTCVAIRSDFPLAEMDAKSKPANVWVVLSENSRITTGTWTLKKDDKVVEVAKGLRFKLDARQLYKLVGGEEGEWLLNFTGTDDKGHIVTCEQGTPLELVKPKKGGRHWFWKLPVVHCAYTFTHDIKKWKNGPLGEKAVCIVEAGVAWYFWPVKGAVTVLGKTKGMYPSIP